jgi:hypothetical protein
MKFWRISNSSFLSSKNEKMNKSLQKKTLSGMLTETIMQKHKLSVKEHTSFGQPQRVHCATSLEFQKIAQYLYMPTHASAYRRRLDARAQEMFWHIIPEKNKYTKNKGKGMLWHMAQSLISIFFEQTKQ